MLIPQRFDANEGIESLPIDQTVARALVLRASGKSNKEVASELGLDEKQMRKISSSNRDLLRQTRQQIKEGLTAIVMQNYDDMAHALIDDVQNPESRTKPQSFKALMESIDMIGQGSVHIGDNVLNVNPPQTLDPLVHAAIQNESPEELDARLKRNRELLRLGRIHVDE